MGYVKGLFTSLGITLPSFLFIHIYNQGFTVAGFFQDLFGGQWEYIFDVCETAILEPIAVFFIAPDALRIFFAFIPWVISAFVVNFFFKKKHAARGGLSTTISIYATAEVIYYLVIQGELLYVETLQEANALYGYLVVTATVTIIGLLSALVSPYKLDKETGEDKRLSRRERRQAARSTPSSFIEEESEDTSTSPYYMPDESPSRDDYMQRQQPQTITSQTGPRPCEYCGSYIDSESEYCSVCGNRI